MYIYFNKNLNKICTRFLLEFTLFRCWQNGTPSFRERTMSLSLRRQQTTQHLTAPVLPLSPRPLHQRTHSAGHHTMTVIAR